MKIPLGMCLVCEQRKKMWRCVDVTGGGTYHGICFDCHDGYAKQSHYQRMIELYKGMAIRALLTGLAFGVIAVGAVVYILVMP